MMSAAVVDQASEARLESEQPARKPFRVRPIMRQGTASSIPETWIRFASVDEARAAIKHMYHDDRVLRAFIVSDEVPAQFVEWVER